MKRADRLWALEHQYRALLEAALRDCAAGSWGLFGHNAHLPGYRPPDALAELVDLADDIDALRSRLGERPFELHARFLQARGRLDANAPGEPKLAALWLAELAG
jgi:hypothetical protein